MYQTTASVQGAVQDKLAHSPIGIPELLERVLSTGAEGEIVMLILKFVI